MVVEKEGKYPRDNIDRLLVEVQDGWFIPFYQQKRHE